MASVSYDVNKFNPKPNAELLCAICHCVINSACMLTCRHIFCKCCIEKWLARSCTCPTCRKYMTKERLQPAPPLVQNVLDSLTMDCEYKDNGCEEHITMEKFVTHLSVCIYKDATCPHKDCQVSTIVKDLPKHKEECQYRSLQCNAKCGLWFPACKLEGHDCLAALQDKVREHSEVIHKHQLVLRWIRNKLNNADLPQESVRTQLHTFHKMVSDINQYWPSDQAVPVLLCGNSSASSVSGVNSTDYGSNLESNNKIPHLGDPLLEKLLAEAAGLHHSPRSSGLQDATGSNGQPFNTVADETVAAGTSSPGHGYDHDSEWDSPPHPSSRDYVLQSHLRVYVGNGHNLPHDQHISVQIPAPADQTDHFSQSSPRYHAQQGEQDSGFGHDVSHIPEQSLSGFEEDESFRSVHSDDNYTAFSDREDYTSSFIQSPDQQTDHGSPTNVNDSDNTDYSGGRFTLRWHSSNCTIDNGSQQSQSQFYTRSRSRSNSSHGRHSHSSVSRSRSYSPGERYNRSRSGSYSRSESISPRRNRYHSRSHVWSSESSNDDDATQFRSSRSRLRNRPRSRSFSRSRSPSWNSQNTRSRSNSFSSTGSYFSGNMTPPLEEFRDHDREVDQVDNLLNYGSSEDCTMWENAQDSSNDDFSEGKSSQHFELNSNIGGAFQDHVYDFHHPQSSGHFLDQRNHPVSSGSHFPFGTVNTGYHDHQPLEMRERDEVSSTQHWLQRPAESSQVENLVNSTTEQNRSVSLLSPGHKTGNQERNMHLCVPNNGHCEPESLIKGPSKHAKKDRSLERGDAYLHSQINESNGNHCNKNVSSHSYVSDPNLNADCSTSNIPLSVESASQTHASSPSGLSILTPPKTVQQAIDRTSDHLRTQYTDRIETEELKQECQSGSKVESQNKKESARISVKDKLEASSLENDIAAEDTSPDSVRHEQKSSVQKDGQRSGECSSSVFGQRPVHCALADSDGDSPGAKRHREKGVSYGKGKALISSRRQDLGQSSNSGSDSDVCFKRKVKPKMHCISSDSDASSQEDKTLCKQNEATEDIAIDVPSTSHASVQPDSAHAHGKPRKMKTEDTSKEKGYQKHSLKSRKRKRHRNKSHSSSKRTCHRDNRPASKDDGAAQQKISFEQQNIVTPDLKHITTQSKLPTQSGSSTITAKLQTSTAVSCPGMESTIRVGITAGSHAGSNISRPESSDRVNTGTDHKRTRVKSGSSGRRRSGHRNVEADRGKGNERKVTETDTSGRFEDNRSNTNVSHTRRSRGDVQVRCRTNGSAENASRTEESPETVDGSTGMVVITDLPVPPSTLQLLTQLGNVDESDSTWTPDTLSESESSSESAEW